MVLSVVLSTEDVSEVFVEWVDPDGFFGRGDTSIGSDSIDLS